PDPATNAALDLQRVSRRHRLLRRLDVLAWKQFEPSVLRRVDAAVVYTERDARILSPRTPPRVLSCIPFGTDFVERFSSSDGAAGGADVLESPRERYELEAALRSVGHESDRLSQLAEDLLLLARLDKGTLPIRR